MSEDETSIDCINENDEIKIIEQLHGVDFSYYDLYLSRHKNENRLRIFFEFNNGLKNRITCVTGNTTIEEMIKILFNKTNIPQSKGEEFYTILYNGCTVSLQDKSTLNDKNIHDGALFHVIQKMSICRIGNGKTLEVYIKENNNLICKTMAGTLQTIKDFNYNLFIDFPKIKRIVNINGKEYDKNDERTFSSIGIRDNFTCNVELNNK